MSLDDVVQKLRQGAPAAARGRFRIDSARALAKLRDFRLARPYDFALELLRAAAAAGARAVALRIDADDFELQADGEVLPAGALPELFSWALTSAGDPEAVRLRLLAFGVLGALATRPARVHLESGSVALELKPPDRVRRVEARTGAALFVHVRRRPGLAVLRRFLRGLEEEGPLREAVLQYPARLTLNGSLLSTRLDPAEGAFLARRDVAGHGRRGFAGIPARLPEPAPAAVRVSTHGILVRERTLPTPVPLRAWVNHDGLRRSASGSDLLDADPAFSALQEELVRLGDEMLAELVRSLGAGDAGTARALLTEAAARHPELRPKLREAPLFGGPSGERITLAALEGERQAGRPLRFAQQPLEADLYTPPVLLEPALTVHQRALLPEGPREDVAAEVAIRRRRRRHQALWERQPAEPATLRPDPSARARAVLEAEGFAGEVSLGDRDAAAVVRYLSSGRLLVQREAAELAPLRLRAVVDSPRLQPDEDWVSLRRDAAVEAAHAAVRGAAERAVSAALQAAGEPPLALRRQGREVLSARAAAREPLPSALLRAPLYPLAGGGWTSLEDMASWPQRRLVLSAWAHAALDGKPVAVAEALDLRVLEAALGAASLLDVSERLRGEAEVRRRLAGPREHAAVAGECWVRAAIEGEGLAGEAALPRCPPGEETQLTLLRDGFRLETLSRPAAFTPVLAVVDAPGLVPRPSWDGAERGQAAFEAVLLALQRAERRLAAQVVKAFPGVRLADLPEGPRTFLAAFLRQEARLEDEPDEVRRAVLEAPLFETAAGSRSLAEVRAAAQEDGRLWVAAPGSSDLALPGRDLREVPAGMLVVVADAATSTLLSEAIGSPPHEPWDELRRRRTRAWFEQQPAREVSLPAELRPQVRTERDGLRAAVGLRAADSEGVAEVEVLHLGRPYCTATLSTRLPLVAVVDMGGAALDLEQRTLPRAAEDQLRPLLGAAEERLVEAALRDPRDPACRRVLLLALGARLERTVPALGKVPLFPTARGPLVAHAEIDGRARIRYVTRKELLCAAGAEELVLLAAQGDEQKALERYGHRRRNVDGELEEELAARRAHEALPAVRELRIPGDVLARLAFEDGDVRGEVALVPGRGRTLAFFREGRPVDTEELEVPPGVAAVVGCDALGLKKGHSGVRRDHVHRRVLARVFGALEQLGADLAAEAEAGRTTVPPFLLAQLGGWLLHRRRDQHPLAALPLLRATDGARLSWRDLLAQQQRHGRVLFSPLAGSLPGQVVWQPGPGELESAPARRLTLADASGALARVAELMSAPEVASLSPPLASPWREPLRGPGMEGELALPGAPSGRLVLELLRGRRPLETCDLEHPGGAHVRVNCDALTPDESWRARRDDAFAAVRAAAEAAFERALARRLSADAPAALLPWLPAAMRAGNGPVADALAAAALFTSSEGLRLSVGAVRGEALRRGSVAVAAPGAGTAAAPHLVVAADAADRGALAVLGIAWEDVTDLLRRQEERRRRLEERRLGALRFTGEALVRLAVDEGGWAGELALPHPPDASAAIVLARAGVAVDRHAFGELGAAGVLDHPELPVDEEWTRAALDEAGRGLLGRQRDALLAALAGRVPTFGPAERAAAAVYALRHLAGEGVASAAQLDRLEGTAASLSRARLLPSAAGGFVDVRAAADAVLRHGALSVVPAPLAPEEAGGALVLLAAPDAPWLQPLERVLGEGSLTCQPDLESWRRHHAERDPDAGDPLARGLRLLRRELELLHAHAGPLGPDGLRTVKLHRRPAARPLHYDAPRGLALLDPAHAGVRRALAAADEDGVYVLLAAIFGAVNRQREDVTDEDEERLLEAIALRLTDAAAPDPSRP